MTKQSKRTKPIPDSENEFRLLAEFMPQIVWVTRADGWNTYFNHQWVEYTGLTLEESYGHGWNKPFHPEDQQRAWDAWQNAVTNNDSYSLECRLRRADGVYRWWLIRGVPVLDDSGNILKWFGTCTDIDDTKQAASEVQIAAVRELTAETLRQSRKTLYDLIERSPFGTYVVDSQFRIAMMNTSSQTGAFRNVYPVIGRNFTEAMRTLWPEEVAAEIIGHFRHTLDTGEAYYSREFINPRQDVEIVESYEWELHRLTLPDGQYGVICYYYDSTKLRQAEVALRESEERHRLLSETMLQGVVLQDANGKIFSMNPAAERILGKSFEELLGETSESVEHHTLREDGSSFPGSEHPAMVALRTGQLVRSVVMGVFNPLEKVYRWISIDAVPIFAPGDTNPRQVYVVFEDITERKKTEDILKDTSEQRRMALEAAELGAWDYKFRTGDVFWDEHCRSQWGIKEGNSFKYTAAIDCIHPEDREATDKAVQRALSKDSDGKFQTECRVVWPDGSVHWITAHGRVYFDGEGEQRSPVRFIGVNRDITDEKRAEEKQQESQERLALAADAGQIGMFDLNIESGELQWTQQHEIIFGYEPTNTAATTSTHTYRDWAERVHPEDLAQVEEHMQRAMEKQIPFQVEYRLVWPDGSVHWVNVASKYYFESDGRCTRLMGAVKDITDQKQLEESLRQYGDTLERKVIERTAELREKDRLLLQQSRLAAMGEMVNNIAHQWRQPLNVLGMNIQNLSVFYDMGDFSKEFLDKTTKDTMKLIAHMSQTIDDFRNFFNPDKEKADFNVNQAIQQAITLIEEIFRQDQIEIVTHIDSEALIHGYPNEFSQAILNILQNARDVLVERKVKDARVMITSFNENDRVVVTIADNGSGIPDEIIEKIYEPYFSTKGVQGTGIGLYLSKSIIEKNMGGSLTVRNNAEGAEFRIEV